LSFSVLKRKKKQIICNWTIVEIIAHVTVMELRTQDATTTSAPASLFFNQTYWHRKSAS